MRGGINFIKHKYKIKAHKERFDLWQQKNSLNDA